MTIVATPEFTRTAVHYADMPCLIEPGDTTTPDALEVTCAQCLGSMPSAPGRCSHDGIFPMQRTHRDGKPLSTYMWCCPCGYQTHREAPARWVALGDNAERLARIDARVAAR